MGMAKIQDGLKDLIVDMATLQDNPAVVKIHSAKNLNVLKASIERFGQVRPVIVDKNNVVRVGNLVFAAMKRLGADKIAAVFPNWTEEQFQEYEIIDNRSSDADIGSEWNEDNVREIVGRIKGSFDLDLLCIGDTEKSSLAKALGMGASSGEKEKKAAGKKEKLARCPRCGHDNPWPTGTGDEDMEGRNERGYC